MMITLTRNILNTLNTALTIILTPIVTLILTIILILIPTLFVHISGKNYFFVERFIHDYYRNYFFGMSVFRPMTSYVTKDDLISLFLKLKFILFLIGLHLRLKTNKVSCL